MVVFVEIPLIFLITLLEIVPVARPLWKIPAVSVLALLAAFVRLLMTLLEIFNGPNEVVVTALLIPYTLEAIAEEVAKEEKRLLEVLALPMVLLVTVTLAVLDTAIPSILAPVVSVPIAVKEPIILLLILTVAGLGVEELIPTMPPSDPGVRVIAPFPVPAPIVLALVVPMLALPEVILIPQRAPPPVFDTLVEVTLIFVIVFPCTEDGVALPTLRAIPWKV